MEEQQRTELARRRDLAKKRQERSKKRLDYLQIVVSMHDEVARIRHVLTLLPSAVSTGDVERFAGWIQNHLADIEAKLTVTGLQSEIQSQQLFPEIDALEDPLGEPPAVTGRW